MKAFEFSNSCGEELAKKIKTQLLKTNPNIKDDVIGEKILEDVIFRFVKIPLKKQYEDYFGTKENVKMMKKKLYRVDTCKKKLKVNYD